MVLLASILDDLFGLSRGSLSDPRASLGWRFPIPAWGWVLIALAAVGVAWWSYRHLLGPRPARIALGVMRALLLLFLAALLSGPMLVVEHPHTEADVLLVLLDLSGSMQTQDVAVPGEAEPISRIEAVRRLLAQHRELLTADGWGEDRRVVWLGFDANTYEIDPADPGEAKGRATALRTAIEQALQRGAGREVAGIVVISDGRTPQPTGGELLHRLQQRQVRVYAVPLGATSSTVDLTIADVQAPQKAFIDDAVPVAVMLDRYPADATIDPDRLKVRLVDTRTGEVLDERPAADAELREPVRLTGESPIVGPTQWRVEVVYEPGAAAPGGEPPRELSTQNNQQTVSVDLTDRPIRVLYVDGYPRWEYRYLKNMLVREKSLESSIVLLSADAAFAQEGTLPITRIPHTPEELRPYDVIIIGDVPAHAFAPEELSLMRDQVATLGSGLIWVGGPYFTPSAYSATVLADLLPMRNAVSVQRADAGLGPLAVAPTSLAAALNVLRLAGDEVDQRGGTAAGIAAAWPYRLPPLFWAQDIGELKPSAEALALAYPASAGAAPQGLADAAADALPALIRLRYGAGQVLYAATDETWRWRYGRGDLYFERFWMQLIRMLGRARLQQNSDRAALSVSSRRVELDQPVLVELRINDELLAQRQLPRVSVAVERDQDGRTRVVERIELVRAEDRRDLTSGGPGGAAPGTTAAAGPRYEALWRPAVDGDLRLRVTEPALDDLDITQPITVVAPDDELRHPAPDPQRLQALARETGGKIVPLAELNQLTVPTVKKVTIDPRREPLWNSYLALGVVLVLITAEWIGRKIIRLV